MIGGDEVPIEKKVSVGCVGLLNVLADLHVAVVGWPARYSSRV